MFSAMLHVALSTTFTATNTKRTEYHISRASSAIFHGMLFLFPRTRFASAASGVPKVKPCSEKIR